MRRRSRRGRRGAGGDVDFGDHQVPHSVERGATIGEDLCGDPLALAHQPEQDVFGADVVVPELEGFAQRQLEDLLGPRGERDVPARRASPGADDRGNVGPSGGEADAELGQDASGDGVRLCEQAEQQVFGSDVLVVALAGLLLGGDHGAAGTIGEALEHVTIIADHVNSLALIGCSANERLGSAAGAVETGARPHGRAR